MSCGSIAEKSGRSLPDVRLALDDDRLLDRELPLERDDRRLELARLLFEPEPDDVFPEFPDRDPEPSCAIALLFWTRPRRSSHPVYPALAATSLWVPSTRRPTRAAALRHSRALSATRPISAR
jgi:hypothetical protein